MKINWKVRLKNKVFWLTVIPALLLAASQLLAVFGVSFAYEALSEKLCAAAGGVFSLLALLGVVNDPTTAGVSDSARALTYAAPAAKENHDDSVR